MRIRAYNHVQGIEIRTRNQAWTIRDLSFYRKNGNTVFTIGDELLSKIAIYTNDKN